MSNATEKENRLLPEEGLQTKRRPPGGVNLDRDFASANPDVVKQLSQHQLVYSLVAQGVGTIFALAGVSLLLTGVIGSTNWVFSGLGIESQLTDATAGVVLFIVGLVIIVAGRYQLKVHK